MDDASKCPVMHGSATNNKGLSTSNKDWWPNQQNVIISIEFYAVLHHLGLKKEKFGILGKI